MWLHFFLQCKNVDALECIFFYPCKNVPVALWLKFGSCWGGVHQFCLSMDNILRNLESLSRTELVWLNTYLVGRLRALPHENDSHPVVPGTESPGSVAMQGPNGVTSCATRLGDSPPPGDGADSGLYPIETANRGDPSCVRLCKSVSLW